MRNGVFILCDGADTVVLSKSGRMVEARRNSIGQTMGAVLPKHMGIACNCGREIVCKALFYVCYCPIL